MMTSPESVSLLHTIVKETKLSFETPVILLTQTDYGDNVFNSLVDMRKAMLQNADPNRMAEIIYDFHLKWLQSVQDIENFRTRLKETPRETIYKSVEYTMKCLQSRQKYLRRYIDQHRTTVTSEERQQIQLELDGMEDTSKTILSVLRDKDTCFRYQVDNTEFHVKVSFEVDELLNWLDRQYDRLSIEIAKVINTQRSNFVNELLDASRKVIAEAAILNNEVTTDGSINVNEVRKKNRQLEIKNLLDRIKNIDRRIEGQPRDTLDILALRHKKHFLQERLGVLEDFEATLLSLKAQKDESTSIEAEKCRIFNHRLPRTNRCCLVEQLMSIWHAAVRRFNNLKSFISILSVSDLQEVCTDEVGQYTIDKHGRKIYRKNDDNNMYQLNEKKELVLVKDDSKHVFFYDDCGRYFVNDAKQHVYKAHKAASEYVLNENGFLNKIKEYKGNLEYNYDNLGRYRIINGQKIYSDDKTDELFCHDGFGNLIPVQNSISNLIPCPVEPMVTEECRYLKDEVGKALSKCLSEVFLRLPADPISYLADRLVKYRRDMLDREKRLEEELKLAIERENRKVSVPEYPQYLEDESQESEYFIDHNYTEYKSMTTE